MKKYYSLGELLVDYRSNNGMTQSDFSIKLGADLRTVQRWEKDETNINEAKVATLVEKTLLPFQLVRNLNASDPIPTFFNFKTQKYSLSKLAIDLPDATWYKKKMDESCERIRGIDVEYDLSYLVKRLKIPKKHHKDFSNILREATILLPEVNVIITDELGYYSGYKLIIPISEDAHKLIKTKKIHTYELNPSHIVDPKFQLKPIFFAYGITADCNDNIQYLVGHLLSYFKKMNAKSYLKN